MEWHHIVEQGGGAVEKFGAKAMHSFGNLVRLPKDVHQAISAYYSTKFGFTGGPTVREWLKGQSFADRIEFGLQIIKDAIAAAQAAADKK